MGFFKKLRKYKELVKSRKQIIKHRKLLLPVLNSYMFFLENPEKSIWGSITEEEEEGIEHAVSLARNYQGPMIEIGALFGHTTCLLATLKAKDVPLIAVENFSWNPFSLSSEIHRKFTQRTLRYVIEHCSTLIFDGSASEFYSANENLKPSMVFIDAGHDYESVKEDIDWAVSVGCPIISGHDYIDAHPGVIKAVDETFGDNISLYGSVWIHHR